jgi:uncharacterized repeat protein (TIGR03803 family)
MNTNSSTIPAPAARIVALTCVFTAITLACAADVAFQPVHSFGLSPPDNPLEIALTSPLIQASDGYLYGTIQTGTDTGYGEVYRISTNGVYTTVYSFNGGSDGAVPETGVTQTSDGNLYGTTTMAGGNGGGTIFRLTTNGALTVLYSFGGGSDGSSPQGSLVQASDGNLYGTTFFGGTNNSGTVYRISTNGGYAQIYSFAGIEGACPSAGLMQAEDGYLYGTTYLGGTNSLGTVFRITTGGTLTSLYSFRGENDGAYPQCVLAQGPAFALYGTTTYNSSGPSGSVFQITPDGYFTSVTVFHEVGFVVGSPIFGTDGFLYCAASGGATNFIYGVVLKVAFNGTLVTNFASFGGAAGVFFPDAGLVQAADGNFYGTTLGGQIYQITAGGTLSGLYSFSGNNGSGPTATLAQSVDGWLYGVTTGRVGYGVGSIFRVATNSTFTNLYYFSENALGPNGIIAASDGYLYGTTGSPPGTIFRMDTNGVFTNLYSFTGGSDGSSPGGLVQASDGNFYGTTDGGGTVTNGTVFRFATNGGLTTLYSFTGESDGGTPNSGVIQASDGNLYGTTFSGGTAEAGTIFRITTNGAFTSLYSLNGGSDGSNCYAGLMQANDGNLYGTTYLGGSNGVGTIFRITTTGSFTVVHAFAGGTENGKPLAGLMQASDGYLYGVTSATIFRIGTNGAYSTLFTKGDDPHGGLVEASDGNLYGTSYMGGVVEFGTIFRVVLGVPATPATLQLALSFGGNFGFTFQASVGQSYTIQQTTNLATANWTVYTNLAGTGTFVQLFVPATNSAQFFRIREP